MWYADPAGRTEIEEFRAAGLCVRKGDNDTRLGIAAVTARLRTGRLKVLSTACVYVPDKTGTGFDVVFVELVGRGQADKYKRVFLDRRAPTFPTNEL